VSIPAISKQSRFRFLEEVYQGVPVLQSADLTGGRLRTGWDPWNTLRRTSRIGSEKPDIIHSIDCRPGCILPALAFKCRRPRVELVLSWHDWYGHGGRIAHHQHTDV
jgi:hypothetical protein